MTNRELNQRWIDTARGGVRRFIAVTQGEFGRYAGLRTAKAVEALSTDVLEEMRLRLLRKTLSHAGRTVPYWREVFKDRGFDPDRVTRLTDIRALPITTKQIIREQGDRMLSEVYKKESLIARSTGGSTGEPLRFYVDRPSYEKQMAINLRSFLLAGIRDGDRLVKIWGYGKPVNLLNTTRYLTGRAFLDAFDTSVPALDSWRDLINRFRPHAIYGYAGAIGHFARYLLDIGERELTVPVVMTTAEKLLPHVREDILAAFHGSVFDTYGCHESIRLATECCEGNMHMHPDAALLEFVDDGAGVENAHQILLTSFLSDAMPFIRYDLGDRGCAVDRKCSCGLEFPLMDINAGKLHSLYVLPDRTVHSSSLHKRFYQVEGVLQFQIHHREKGVIEVLVVLGPEKEEETRNRLEMLAKTVQDDLGNATTVQLKYVPEIPKTKRGKHNPIRSSVPEDS